MWAVRSSPFEISSIPAKYYRTYRSVTLLGLAGLAGEDNEARAVLLQPVNVKLLTLLALAPPSVVDNDTESLGGLLLDTSELELRKSESSALCTISQRSALISLQFPKFPPRPILRLHLAPTLILAKTSNSPLIRMLYR